jgi:hypothetical protein
MMKSAFTPISFEAYVEKHLQANPGDSRKEITAALKAALDAFKSGQRCECGNPIWVIGSAVAGNACFTCITGSADPTEDFEIAEACEEK